MVPDRNYTGTHPSVGFAPCKIRGVAKHYAWGSIGSKSAVAKYISQVDESKPYAELWFGAHPSGPSPVVDSHPLKSLRDVIAAMPDGLLGDYVVSEFGALLPFMLKILSIRKALSLQAHPSLEQARILHERRPDLYPDANHKPEIAIALTPVRLLYGFKAVAELRSIADAVLELREIFSPQLFSALREGTQLQLSSLLRRCMSEVLDADSSNRERVAAVIRERAIGQRAHSHLLDLFVELSADYSLSDPGLFIALLMNEVNLPAGSAIFVPAGVLHAYLAGDLVECMANSDNVVRAGLTEKPQDREALFEVVNFSHTAPAVIKPSPHQVSAAVRLYDTPAREFKVEEIEIKSSDVSLPQIGAPAMYLCVEGQFSYASTNAKETLTEGDALFVPAGEGGCILSAEHARVFRARVPRSGLGSC